MTAFKPYNLEPNDAQFSERLASRLYLSGLIPRFNQLLAMAWYERERRQHLLQEIFPNRSVFVQWQELPEFSARTLINYVPFDPTTPAESLVCDGKAVYETPLAAADPGEYKGGLDISHATFCVHWRPKSGDVMACLSIHCSLEKLEQQLRTALK